MSDLASDLAKMTTAEVPLPPKNPEIAPEAAATNGFPFSS
jgi:hypothetical protein